MGLKSKEQLLAELSELREWLVEANHRISELETECERMQQMHASSEERIQRHERLAAVGQLAGGIAHDFGNFLTTNIFHLELLLNDPRLPSDLTPSVQTILGASRRTARLVRQILDFSRRETIKVQPIDLASFVGEVVAILRRTLPENIQLFVETEPGEYVASIDPARMEQVLVNLALNARDAMPDGGKMHIGLSKTETAPGGDLPGRELSLTDLASVGVPGGEWVCVSVSDTGIGMTDDVQSQIFEPFFTTKGEKGTGLGLAQVYSIVTQHDGHIGVETAVGHGTTFSVYLPACNSESEALCGIATAPKGQGETVLFVEDEEKMREAGRLILEHLGYSVLVAANGREALELLSPLDQDCPDGTCGIDLVITDLVMPEMGGLEMLGHVRESLPHVKALAITGHSLLADVEELEEARVQGTIQKPFEVDALAQAVRLALDVS